MIRRIIAALVLFWAAGFVLFVLTLPKPADNATTDAIVVLTGAPGRIERGLAMLEAHRAKRMLISGVDRSVTSRQLSLLQRAPQHLFGCCVDLGHQAIDTRSNGSETATWLEKHDYHSVRLVTTDWHMRRARFELEHVLGARAIILPDAVESEADLSVLLLEYNKYLFRRAVVLAGQ